MSRPALFGGGRVGGALLALFIAHAAQAQNIPPDVAAAIESELASSRAAVAAARSGAHGNAPLAERQAQSARERGNAAIAAIVIDAIARYPSLASDIVVATTSRAPETRPAVLSAVQRAYPTFAGAATQAAAAPPLQGARGGAATPAAARRDAPPLPTIPPDVEAELRRAARPSPDGTRAVAGSTGNQPLASQIASYDDRQVGAAVSGTVVTAIARYPNQTREIVAAAVALAPQVRGTVESQAVNAYPAFADAIRAGAANPGLGGPPEKEVRTAKRRVQDGPEPLWDPIEPVNRGIFFVNDLFDQYLLRPVAWVYSYAPEPMKRSVANFFTNLGSPALFANDLLQGELVDATKTFGRFGLNTTIGVVGLFDPATSLGVPAHYADFGQTLHQYGVGPGPYIVLPLFGPSTLRDGVGLGVDSAMRPEAYLAPTVALLAVGATQAVSKRETLLKPLDDLRANSVDYYATLRSAYYQNRVLKLNRQVGGEFTSGGGTAPSGKPSNTETDKLFDEAK